MRILLVSSQPTSPITLRVKERLETQLSQNPDIPVRVTLAHYEESDWATTFSAAAVKLRAMDEGVQRQWQQITGQYHQHACTHVLFLLKLDDRKRSPMATLGLYQIALDTWPGSDAVTLNEEEIVGLDKYILEHRRPPLAA